MSEKGSDEEELFSMEELEKDLKKGRGARRAPWFLGGLILGVVGTIALPPLLAPYLPDALRRDRELLSGPVLAEERESGRLLLTIAAEPGAFIASFTERVAEIALLVEPGDIVTVSVPDYEPFIENPDFEGVKKGTGSGTPTGVGQRSGEGDPVAPADSAAPAAPDSAAGEAPDSTAATSDVTDAARSDSSGGGDEGG